MSSPKKLLFTPLSIFISHVTRCLCVAEELVKKGYHIEFTACNKYKYLIEDAGFKVHEVKEISYRKAMLYAAPSKYKDQFDPEISKLSYGFKEIIASDAALLKKISPDMIIYDGRITMLFPALISNIPCMEIRNHIGVLSQKEYLLNSRKKELEDSPVNFDDEQNFGVEYARAVLSFPEYKKQFTSEIFNKAPVLIPGIEEFEIANGNNSFEERECHFIGPLFWNGWKKNKTKFPHIKEDRVAVVAIGSTFPFKEIMQNICKALQGEYHIVIITGDNFSMTNKDLESDNYTIIKYIDLDRAFKNVDLIFHHGGHGTTMYALKAGVPSIVMPFNGDHMAISAQIEKLKLGTRIKKYPNEIEISDIKNAVEKINSDKEYSQNVKIMSEKIQEKSFVFFNTSELVEKYI